MKKTACCFAILFIVLFFSAAVGESVYTPGGYDCGHENCYWSLPMDINDTEAVWSALTAPMTVLNGNQKQAYQMRAEPREDAAQIADITYASQSVHVIETLDNGWTLVEAYSGSFYDSTVKVYGDLVRGYVPTALLKVVTPDQNMGLVVDKLSQQMYVFVKGQLYAQLAISTGLPNEEQPYNETQAGEYMIVSAVGTFYSDNLVCEMGLRFNNGNLIHQVPYVESNGKKFFEVYEAQLGSKASHGCIRVQRKRTPEGANMTWLWNRKGYAKGVKVFIWEDFKGRQMPTPAPDTNIYYNAKGNGKTYHDSPVCYGVGERYMPMTKITYADLDTPAFSTLTPCPYCNPPLRPAAITLINAHYAAE